MASVLTVEVPHLVDVLLLIDGTCALSMFELANAFELCWFKNSKSFFVFLIEHLAFPLPFIWIKMFRKYVDGSLLF